MVLQWVHAASILRQPIIVSDGFSRLGVLFSVPPLSFSNMLLVTRGRRGVEYLTFSHSSYMPT